MRIAYFDSVAGVSGDMFVAALIDAGASVDLVKAETGKLGFPGVSVEASRIGSHGIAATRFRVIDLPSGADVEEVEGKIHRSPGDLARIIEESAIDSEIRRNALAVINFLAVAEAAVHGVGVDEVHFHEIGALDTLFDAVAASAAFISLSIDRAHGSPVPVGGGFVNTRHGRLPVPAPATLRLLEGIPVRHGGVDRELATPTGVALLKHFCGDFGPMPEMIVERSGYGAGSRDIGFPNVFRAVIGRS